MRSLASFWHVQPQKKKHHVQDSDKERLLLMLRPETVACVQTRYFLLAPLNHLMNVFPRRSYFLLAPLNYLMNLFPRRSYFLN